MQFAICSFELIFDKILHLKLQVEKDMLKWESGINKKLYDFPVVTRSENMMPLKKLEKFYNRFNLFLNILGVFS